ncbi:MAG: aquaporin family protein [Flammeovirgaceae bacterium]|nr:aquaporin family protein [Flammeovirgaceae bacterium]
MSPYVGEYLGTLLLILLGNGVVAGVLLKNSKSENAGWLTIVLGWGIAVALAIYAVGNISGAHINPAVTVGLAWAGDFEWSSVPGYIIAQLLGAFTGAVLVYLHYLPHWKQTSSTESKLAVFCTAPAIRNAFANLASEVLGTTVLVFGLLFIGVNNFAEGLNPIVIGVLIVSIGLSLGGTTGFAINPARDVAPRLVHFILPIHGKGSSDWKYAWIPIVGPILGAILGASLYQLLFT